MTGSTSSSRSIISEPRRPLSGFTERWLRVVADRADVRGNAPSHGKIEGARKSHRGHGPWPSLRAPRALQGNQAQACTPTASATVCAGSVSCSAGVMPSLDAFSVDTTLASACWHTRAPLQRDGGPDRHQSGVFFPRGQVFAPQRAITSALSQTFWLDTPAAMVASTDPPPAARSRQWERHGSRPPRPLLGMFVRAFYRLPPRRWQTDSARLPKSLPIVPAQRANGPLRSGLRLLSAWRDGWRSGQFGRWRP